MITDVGFHEDEDAGVRCSVTCRRDPLSIVLGVAAIIAIARVAGRAVWDEALLLGHERVNDPGFLMNALRVSETPDLETATRSLLARTAIRLPDRTADRLCQEP
ncbi:hypothetical protein [Actinomadura sp. 7K507]|uniref:hypothetical protein n=1 Tax=Actinomadura sp. 7K507 TaxID=2530365 RepID=UPI0010489C9D|nr:hypothetical protein [Actinomadura sp. 7K507]TDC83678.1 hypothetical protein E1285_28405 [Actinomadura sp. 7K507]